MSVEEEAHWTSPHTGTVVPFEARPHWNNVTALLVISVVDEEMWCDLKRQWRDWRTRMAGCDPVPDASDSACGIVPYINIRRRRDAELRTGLGTVLRRLNTTCHAPLVAFILAARLSDATRITPATPTPIKSDLVVSEGVDDAHAAYMALYITSATLASPSRSARANKNDIVRELWNAARRDTNGEGVACIIVRAPKWLVEYVDTHNAAACVFRRIRAAILADVHEGGSPDFCTPPFSEVMLTKYKAVWDARIMWVFVKTVEVNLRAATDTVRKHRPCVSP